ncbi:fumarylacetoacetate hydrolase family protein [Blastococcus deserti]|uniref:Fumarylacetoacetate hydrolase family protein n=1 Tax=Blastococcus deserti TaxID=2259033 RepID=A0ABW4XEX8_9ACTN
MRLVTYSDGTGSRVGVRRDGEVVPLGAAGTSLTDLPLGDVAALRRLAEGDGGGVPAGSVELLAPVRPSGCVYCVGWNYLDHFAEGHAAGGHKVEEMPAHPTFFFRAPATVVGPGEDIPIDPRLSPQLDYEAEIAVVIGRGGRNVPEDRAWEHVLGLTLANDVTVRDIQRRHGNQWSKGKSIDGTCPLGPEIVTLDEVGDLSQVKITCTVNGELRQSATLGQMAFPIPRILSELSAGMTLRSGDVVLTGTPSGVGYARKPPAFLTAGDEVVVAATGLGELRNRVVEADLTSYVRSAAD